MIDKVRGFFSATLSVRVLSSDGQLHCLFPQLLTAFLCPRLARLVGSENNFGVPCDRPDREDVPLSTKYPRHSQHRLKRLRDNCPRFHLSARGVVWFGSKR